MRWYWLSGSDLLIAFVGEEFSCHPQSACPLVLTPTSRQLHTIISSSKSSVSSHYCRRPTCLLVCRNPRSRKRRPPPRRAPLNQAAITTPRPSAPAPELSISTISTILLVLSRELRLLLMLTKRLLRRCPLARALVVHRRRITWLIGRVFIMAESVLMSVVLVTA